MFLLRKKKKSRQQNWGKGDGQETEKAENVIGVGKREEGVGGEEPQEMERFLENKTYPDLPSYQDAKILPFKQ